MGKNQQIILSGKEKGERVRVTESERVRERERIDCDDSFRNQSISIEVEASPGKKTINSLKLLLYLLRR